MKALFLYGTEFFGGLLRMKRYNVGENVIHCPEGVCKVEDICQMVYSDKIFIRGGMSL